MTTHRMRNLLRFSAAAAAAAVAALAVHSMAALSFETGLDAFVLEVVLRVGVVGFAASVLTFCVAGIRAAEHREAHRRGLPGASAPSTI